MTRRAALSRLREYQENVAPAVSPTAGLDTLPTEDLRAYRVRLLAEKAQLCAEIAEQKRRGVPEHLRGNLSTRVQSLDARLTALNARMKASNIGAAAVRMMNANDRRAEHERNIEREAAMRSQISDPALQIPGIIVAKLLDIIDRMVDDGADLTDRERANIDGSARWLEKIGLGDR